MVNEVFVSGLGCVSALGLGVDVQLEKLIAEESGLGTLNSIKTNHRVVVGEVKHSTREMADLLDLQINKEYSRTMVLGLLAAKEALINSGINPYGLKIGLISATSVGGMDISEIFYKEYLKDNNKGRLKQLIGHDCGVSTQFIEKKLGINGFATTINTACSSANNAIILGTRMIKAGLLDAVIAGGTDSLCRFTINGFSSLGILDNDLCRPFDESRSGLNLGEGAGYLVLHSPKIKTNQIYCSVGGYANANDAFHQTASSLEGKGAYMAMKEAIGMSGMDIMDIGYINVHGTGTQNNDASEGIALKRIFGDNIPDFSSTKGYTGHTLGAAGGIESVFSILSLYYGYAWPNLNFKNSISEVSLFPVTSCKKKNNITAVLTNSFGFGGNCTSLIFKSCKNGEL